MTNQSIACNTITFGILITPISEIFAQSFIVWDNFISSPNDSILILNTSMFNFTSGVLSISYFLLSDLQNETLIFDANFSTLYENSSIFVNTTSPSLSFMVSTSNPEAVVNCC